MGDDIVSLTDMVGLLLRKGESIRTQALFLGEGYDMTLKSIDYFERDGEAYVELTGDIDGPIGEQEIDYHVPLVGFNHMNLHRRFSDNQWDLY